MAFKDIRGNWAAQTDYMIPGHAGKRLVIDTMKVNSGDIVTVARSERQILRGWIWDSSLDFRMELQRSHPSRVTDKYVDRQHAVATHDTNPLIARAIAFYKEHA